MFKKLFFIFLVSVITINVNAQKTKAQLKSQESKLNNEIAQLKNELKDLRNKKNQPLAELKAVNRKLQAREELVSTINRKISSIKDEVYYTNLDIYRLNNELDTLKKQYAQSLVFAYKNRSNYDYLNFLFSANSFSDAMKRLQYLKSYRQLRETQLGNIKKTQQLLEKRKQEFENGEKEQQLALKEHSNEIKNLQDDKQDVNNTINKLKSQEGEITAKIKKKNKERQNVANAIVAAIKLEEKNNIAKPKVVETPKNKPKTITTPGLTDVIIKQRPASNFEKSKDEVITSLSFESKKGKLQAPVNGRVITNFGITKVQGTGLEQELDGIEYATSINAAVRAVADGEVTFVADAGDGWFITIRHGKYTTGYSHLSNTSVSKGQKVKAGTVIGSAASNDDNSGMLRFMILEGKTFINPLKWIQD